VRRSVRMVRRLWLPDRRLIDPGAGAGDEPRSMLAAAPDSTENRRRSTGRPRGVPMDVIAAVPNQQVTEQLSVQPLADLPEPGSCAPTSERWRRATGRGVATRIASRRNSTSSWTAVCASKSRGRRPSSARARHWSSRRARGTNSGMPDLPGVRGLLRRDVCEGAGAQRQGTNSGSSGSSRMRGSGEGSSQRKPNRPPTAAMSSEGRNPIQVPSAPPASAPSGRTP
jgi:hypothetical protein